MYSAGDIVGVSVNHPNLGQMTFEPYSGEDSTYFLGGQVSNDDDNMVGAQGNMIDQMSYMRPYFQTAIAGAPGDGTLEKLQALQSDPLPGVYVFTSVNGSNYKLTGKPVGSLTGGGKDAKITLKVAGSGKLEII